MEKKLIRTVSRTVDETNGVDKNYIVVMSSESDSVSYQSSAGEGKVVGIVYDDADDGKPVEIVTEGIEEVYCDMAVNRGDYLMASATAGKVTKAENATAAETEICGMSEETIPEAGLVLMNLSYNGTTRTV